MKGGDPVSERAQTMDEEIELAVLEASASFRGDRFRALARTVQAIERERCAKVAEHYAVGIVDSGDMECCGSNEQAWLISRSEEIAAAIRNPEPPDEKEKA